VCALQDELAQLLSTLLPGLLLKLRGGAPNRSATIPRPKDAAVPHLLAQKYYRSVISHLSLTVHSKGRSEAVRTGQLIVTALELDEFGDGYLGDAAEASAAGETEEGEVGPSAHSALELLLEPHAQAVGVEVVAALRPQVGPIAQADRAGRVLLQVQLRPAPFAVRD
jgi:hypothetical protein